MIHTFLRTPSVRQCRGTLLASVLLLCAGCEASGPETIDRSAFIDTYVDLRVAALDTDSLRLGETEREEVLSRHGVSEADLMRFVDVHAADAEYMRDVWNDIELLLDRPPPSPD